MRIRRVDKFKKIRRIKARNFVLFGLFLPTSLIVMGYLISSLVILPSMKK